METSSTFFIDAECYLPVVEVGAYAAERERLGDNALIVVLGVAVVAAIAGVLRGGSLSTLADTRFRWGWLIFAGLALQLGFDLWDPDWLTRAQATAIVLASNGLILVFVMLNRALAGMWLIGVGLALNALVIGANQGMPVSVDAAHSAGAPVPNDTSSIKHERMDDDTLLPWLGDVIPLSVGNQVLSIGDLVLAAGMGWLVNVRTRERS
ncbi:MAG: DUF5317 domain-containing protein [Actinomycetota bacterium]|nr:DUF5317 domain-containing protein [Actinomycetota bacterium]